MPAELDLVNAICKNKDVHVILGQDSEMFGAYADIVESIVEYYHKHRSVPEFELMADRFGVEKVPVYGTSQHYLEEVRSNFLRSKLQKMFLGGAKALETDSPSRILEKMQQKVSELGKYTTAVRDLDLTDADAAEEYFEKLREMTDENGGIGIPTGFKSIDPFYPTGMAPGHSITLLGFAQPHTEPVLTPDGWKTMADIKAGDYVVGSYGPTKVIETFEQGSKEVYKVSFTDGTSVRCDIDHLWSVQTRKMKQNGSGYKTVTTKEIAQRVKYNEAGSNTMYKYFMPLPKPINRPEQSLDLGPYLTGLMLANGSFRSESIRLTTNDEECVQLAKEDSPLVSIVERTYRNSSARQWLVEGGYKQNSLFMEMKNLGSADKYIPDRYLNSSVDQRIQLLRGLMDGDGSIYPPHQKAEYKTTSPKLAEGVANLVRSLGGIARVKVSTQNRGYQVKIWTDFNPFSSSKKARIWTPWSYFKAIESVESLGFEEDMKCIKVDAADSLYITRGYNLTHNTGKMKSWFMLLLAIQAWSQGHKVMIMSLEMSPEEQRERAYALMGSGLFDMRDLTRGTVDEDDFRSFRESILKDKTNFIVVSNEGISEVTPNIIQAKIDVHKPAWVGLDYLQLMKDNAKTQAMTPRMLNLSREVKMLAVSNAIPIVSISAVTDDENDKRDSPPMLSQIAWSSGIEYDSNLAIAVHKHDDSDMVEIAARKNRHGELFGFYFEVDAARGIWKEQYELQ